MVGSVTNFGRNGLADWLWQRASAIFMLCYVVFLATYLCLHPHVTLLQWQTLFSHLLMKIATVLVAVSLFVHIWIGLWIVFTDYVNCACLRIVLQLGLVALLLGYLIWIFNILWG